MVFSIIKKLFHRKSPAVMLTDTSLAVIIMLVLLGVAGLLYYGVSDTSKVSQMQSNLLVLRSQINQVYTGSTSYDDLDNATAIRGKLVPTAFIRGNRLVNPWGGDITLGAIDDGSAFTISIEEIPSSICTQLGAFQADSWLAVEVNGTTIENGSVSALTEACDNNDNTIVFTAR